MKLDGNFYFRVLNQQNGSRSSHIGLNILVLATFDENGATLTNMVYISTQKWAIVLPQYCWLW